MRDIDSDDLMYFECSLAGCLRQIGQLTELDVERHTRYAIDASFADGPEEARLSGLVSSWWNEPDADRRGPAPEASGVSS